MANPKPTQVLLGHASVCSTSITGLWSQSKDLCNQTYSQPAAPIWLFQLPSTTLIYCILAHCTLYESETNIRNPNENIVCDFGVESINLINLDISSDICVVNIIHRSLFLFLKWRIKVLVTFCGEQAFFFSSSCCYQLHLHQLYNEEQLPCFVLCAFVLNKCVVLYLFV